MGFPAENILGKESSEKINKKKKKFKKM